jgi:hypothetical protein
LTSLFEIIKKYKLKLLIVKARTNLIIIY